MSDQHNCDICSMYESFGVDIFNPCSESSSQYQYASIDSYIDHLELPLLSDKCFYGHKTDPLFCILPDAALRLSMFSIIGTYTNVSAIIFFTPFDIRMFDFIKFISRIFSTTLPCITLSVSRDNDDGTFKIIHYETSASYNVNEEQMISVISDIIELRRSITFYIDENSAVYSSRLQNGSNSMWVSMLHKNTVFTGECSHAIMPSLYNNPIRENALQLNIGIGQMRTLVMDSIPYQLNNINLSMLSITSKDKLCYCCAYMKSLHDKLCRTSQRDHIDFTTGLMHDFLRK